MIRRNENLRAQTYLTEFTLLILRCERRYTFDQICVCTKKYATEDRRRKFGEMSFVNKEAPF